MTVSQFNRCVSPLAPRGRSYSRLLRLCVTGATLAIACLASARPVAAQTFSGLGFLPGGSASAARGVSADGSVVVGDAGPAFSGTAFRWTSVGGMQDLGTLSGGTYSFAAGVSGNGLVISGYSDSPDGQRAFRWTQAGGMVSLGVLTGGTQSLGGGLSSDGSVISGVSGSTDGYRAYRWTNAGGLQNLGTQPGAGAGAISFGYSTNGDGSVVVGDGYSPIGDTAFRWTNAGGMVNLGTLPGGTFSYGYAVSADGRVVVGDSDSTDGDIAYRWTANGGMQSIGTLPIAFDYMISNGVNADGSVIVGSTSAFFPDGTGHAWLWTPSLGIVDLNTYLPSLGIDMTDWVLVDGGGVSADGRTIVGTGNHNGLDEAWIATVPCYAIPGDGNGDGIKNGEDVAPLVNILTGGGAPTSAYCAYDLNHDGGVTLTDVPLFISLLTH